MYLSTKASELIVLAENVRDLGIIINNKLDYKDHIDKVYKKAKQLINLLLWAFNLRSPSFMKFVYAVDTETLREILYYLLLQDF